MRTLLYETANLMLTHYGGQLKLKDWAPHQVPNERAENAGTRKLDTRKRLPPSTH